jgi:hypothetical protein
VFAEVENFLLYDFYTPEGYVNEDVFAHSNRYNDERGLVVYHNKFAETRGWIKTSSAYMDKVSGQLVQNNLGDGLSLPQDGYAIFKDYVSQLEYIRPCRELWEKGLYVELGGYQRHVFMDWRFVDGEQWAKVYGALNGAGAKSMQWKWDEMFVIMEEADKKPKPKRNTKSISKINISTKKSGKPTTNKVPKERK